MNATERLLVYHAYHSSQLTTRELVDLAREWDLDETVAALDMDAPGAREVLQARIWLDAQDYSTYILKERFGKALLKDL